MKGDVGFGCGTKLTLIPSGTGAVWPDGNDAFVRPVPRCPLAY